MFVAWRSMKLWWWIVQILFSPLGRLWTYTWRIHIPSMKKSIGHFLTAFVLFHWTSWWKNKISWHQRVCPWVTRLWNYTLTRKFTKFQKRRYFSNLWLIWSHFTLINFLISRRNHQNETTGCSLLKKLFTTLAATTKRLTIA